MELFVIGVIITLAVMIPRILDSIPRPTRSDRRLNDQNTGTERWKRLVDPKIRGNG